MLLTNSHARQLSREEAHFKREHQPLFARHRLDNLFLQSLYLRGGVADGHETMLPRSSAGDGAENDKRLFPGNYFGRERCVGRIMRQILLAGKEA